MDGATHSAPRHAGAGGTGTGRLVRIGMALIGVEILFANVLYAAMQLADPQTDLAGAPIAVGLAAGAVIVAGVWSRKTAGRGLVGACTTLAGTVFLWTYSVAAVVDSAGYGVYLLLFFSPAGAPLGVALFIMGLKVFARERLVGLCMVVPGTGFLPFLVYVIVQAHGVDHLFPLDIGRYWGMAVGTSMLVLGLAMVWHDRRTRPGQPDVRSDRDADQ